MCDTYVALDVETTGLSPKSDKIIEIGAVLVEKGVMRDTFSTFVNPRRDVPEKIVEITGITQQDLAGAPEIGDILGRLRDFIGERDLLGHRILFDYSFLKKAFVNGGMSFEKKGIDTLKLARSYLPELASKRLCDLCAYFGISQQAHRALEDARAAHLLFAQLKERFYPAQGFAATPLLYQVKKEAPAGKRQKERLLALAERHQLTLPGEVDAMTKNEVSRLTDQILAVHGR